MSEFNDDFDQQPPEAEIQNERHALVPGGSNVPRVMGNAAMAEAAPYQRYGYAAEESRETLAEYWMIIRRRWKLIASLAAACILLAALLNVLIEPVYKATSKLIFDPQRSTLMMMNGELTAITPLLGTQVELVASRETAIKASALLKGEQNIDLPPEAIQASIRPSVIEDTDLLKIDVYHKDPAMAGILANTVARAFVEWNEERMKKGGRDTADYLSKQLEIAKRDLLTAENNLKEFKEQKKVVSLSEETTAKLTNISKLEEESATTLADLQSSERQRQQARSEVAMQNARLSSSGSVRDNELVQGLKQKLVGLEADLASAKQRYTDRYPGVISGLEKQVADTRQRLNHEVQAIISGKAGELAGQQAAVEQLSALEGKSIALRARESALEGIISKEKQALSTVPADEVELARLTRDADTSAKIYTNLLERSQEAKINQVMQVGSVGIAEEAVKPSAPIKPRKTLNLTFGLIFGLLLGVGVAFLLEFMDDSIKDATEATRFARATLLGMIPRTDGARTPIALTKPKSPITEAYRTLRSNVVFTGVGVKVPAVLVTSAGAGEGKSATAANLAVTMAQTGKRVIIVDTDLRRPVLHRVFSAEAGPGLTDVILGNCTIEEALQPTQVEGLQLLPSGALPPNPAELIDSQSMVDIVEDLKKRADVIFFDSPPLVPVTDAVLLSTYCDKVLLVAGAGETSRQSLVRARQLLDQARASVAGVVLNKLDPGRHGRYYDSYYYYYYYHHDGDEQGEKKKRRRSLPALAASLLKKSSGHQHKSQHHDIET